MSHPLTEVRLRRGNGRPTFLAFYLPQFHPIPENDEWWGPGFTEWVNVVAARPRFRGHYQPHLPGELGFYDLRLRETRLAQASLAAEHRIDGFCYYHYWFNGRRLLNRPLDEIRRLDEPDLLFCLCWANENWTREWDGMNRSVLLAQQYDEDDDRRHGRWLTEVFADRRYIHVDGRPLFLVYRASLLPDPRRTTDIWRSEATRAGLPEPFLCRVESMLTDRTDPRKLGFDAAVEFQPDWKVLTNFYRKRLGKLLRRMGFNPQEPRDRRLLYTSLASTALGKAVPDWVRFTTVTPSWDNSPRRKRGAFILEQSTPALYGEWLASAAAATPYGLLFINAWNEWGEGCHLEPDRRWGSGYLEAHRQVVDSLVAPAVAHAAQQPG